MILRTRGALSSPEILRPFLQQPKNSMMSNEDLAWDQIVENFGSSANNGAMLEVRLLASSMSVVQKPVSMITGRKP